MVPTYRLSRRQRQEGLGYVLDSDGGTVARHHWML